MSERVYFVVGTIIVMAGVVGWIGGFILFLDGIEHNAVGNIVSGGIIAAIGGVLNKLGVKVAQNAAPAKHKIEMNILEKVTLDDTKEMKNG